MQRSISSIGLLFASVSAILGSGWLFVAYYTSIITGPSAVISWLIGGLLMGIVAFTFAELSAMIPITGSSTRIPHYTHGNLVSFLFAWIIWLSYVALAPTEVQAVLQYMSYFFPTLTHHASGALTSNGYIAAVILMLVMTCINIFSLRWLVRANNFLTVLKIIIPIIISIAIIAYYFHPSHEVTFLSRGLFPAGMHGVFGAIATGGIVFAFNGFKQACEMAGEAKKPKKSLPFAIIGSIVICLLIYLLLQFSFLTSVNNVSLAHGWSMLQHNGGTSPFATILAHNGISGLLTLLYVGAIIGPLAAGLMYTSSASRSLYGMSKNDYIPAIFQKLTTQGNPVIGIIVNFFIGILMFLPLPGWNKMVSFLTTLMSITYAISPICLLSLRTQAPKQLRPLKLPCVSLWSGIAFYICTLLAYWSGWDILSKLAIALLIGLAVLLAYHNLTERGRQLVLDWRPSLWMWPYFIGLILLSYLGNFGHGHGVIPFGWDFIVFGVFCSVILWASQRFQHPPETTQAFLKELKLYHHKNQNELS